MTYRHKFLSLIVATLLLASSVAVLTTTVLPANAQQGGAVPSGDRAARNWEYAMHDSWSTN